MQSYQIAMVQQKKQSASHQRPSLSLIKLDDTCCIFASFLFVSYWKL